MSPLAVEAGALRAVIPALQLVDEAGGMSRVDSDCSSREQYSWSGFESGLMLRIA